MTSTETVMAVVAQALFKVAADGTVSVVACSLDGAETEGACLSLARPHLSLAKDNRGTSAGNPNRGTGGKVLFPLPGRRSSARLP